MKRRKFVRAAAWAGGAALFGARVGCRSVPGLRGGSAGEIPDFTRGGWRNAEPFGVVTM